MLTFILLLVCVVATVITDVIGEPPAYLVGLLGTAAGAFFAAIGSDKQKRDTEVAEIAQRAEAKADALGRAASREHPEDDDDELPYRRRRSSAEDDESGGDTG